MTSYKKEELEREIKIGTDLYYKPVWYRSTCQCGHNAVRENSRVELCLDCCKKKLKELEKCYH